MLPGRRMAMPSAGQDWPNLRCRNRWRRASRLANDDAKWPATPGRVPRRADTAGGERLPANLGHSPKEQVGRRTPWRLPNCSGSRSAVRRSQSECRRRAAGAPIPRGNRDIGNPPGGSEHRQCLCSTCHICLDGKLKGIDGRDMPNGTRKTVSAATYGWLIVASCCSKSVGEAPLWQYIYA